MDTHCVGVGGVGKLGAIHNSTYGRQAMGGQAMGSATPCLAVADWASGRSTQVSLRSLHRAVMGGKPHAGVEYASQQRFVFCCYPGLLRGCGCSYCFSDGCAIVGP